MNSLISSQDESFIEAHTPRYWYHCREHLSSPLLRYDDRHFHEGHGGRSATVLRVRCMGPLCTNCIRQPDAKETANIGAKTSQPTASPNQLAKAASKPAGQLSSAGSAEDSDDSFEKEPSSDQLGDVSQFSHPSQPPSRQAAGHGTAVSVRSMAAGQLDLSGLEQADDGSGDEVDVAVAAELQNIMGDVQGIMAGRARHQQAVQQAFQLKLLASIRQVSAAVKAQVSMEEAEDSRQLARLRKDRTLVALS